MRQQCCLIQVKHAWAILVSSFTNHWRGLLREELRLFRCAIGNVLFTGEQRGRSPQFTDGKIFSLDGKIL
jgi:hypothetical protein